MPTLGPLPKKVAGEATVRWAVTVAFLGCTAALMWALGVSMSPVAGLAAGTVIFGGVGAVLWGRYLEDVRDERTRASSGGGTGRLFRPEVDEDEPPASPAASQQSRSGGYYDDEDD